MDWINHELDILKKFANYSKLYKKIFSSTFKP